MRRRFLAGAAVAVLATGLVSPSSSTAATVSNGVLLVGGFGVAVMEPHQGATKTYLSPMLGGGDHVFSPDGSKIAYDACDFDAGTCEIRIRTVGGDDTLVTGVGEFIEDLTWSPDGTTLAYERSNGFDPTTIETVSATGGTPIVAFPRNEPQSDPSYGPDGKLYYTRGSDLFANATQLTHQCEYTNDPDHSWGPCSLTSDAFFEDPVMSSTGRLAAHTWGDAWEGIVEIDGSGVTHLVADADAPGWSPDGSLLTYRKTINGRYAGVIGIGTDRWILDDYFLDWQPCPGGTCVSWTATKEPSSIVLNYKAADRVKVFGQVTPAHHGQAIKVTLDVKKGSKWVTVASKSATLSSFSRYLTYFPKQNQFMCRATARFPGDADHKPSSDNKLFSC